MECLLSATTQDIHKYARMREQGVLMTKGNALSCACVCACIHMCVSHSPRTHQAGRKLCWLTSESQGSSCSFLLSSGKISLRGLVFVH